MRFRNFGLCRMILCVASASRDVDKMDRASYFGTAHEGSDDDAKSIV